MHRTSHRPRCPGLRSRRTSRLIYTLIYSAISHPVRPGSHLAASWAAPCGDRSPHHRTAQSAPGRRSVTCTQNELGGTVKHWAPPSQSDAIRFGLSRIRRFDRSQVTVTGGHDPTPAARQARFLVLRGSDPGPAAQDGQAVGPGRLASPRLSNKPNRVGRGCYQPRRWFRAPRS